MEPELTNYRSFGAYIANERIRRGLSLDEVAEGTKINLRYLEAFECDAFEEYPEQPYALGFIRSYAKFLGIDEDTAIIHFQYFYQDYLQHCRKPPRRLVPFMGYRIPVVSLVVGSTLGLVLFVYLAHTLLVATRTRHFRSEHIPTADHPQAVQALRVITPQPANPDAALTVSLRALGTTWIQVKIDDYTEYSERLYKGEIRNWDAYHNIKIRTGSWELVEILKNGQPYPNPQSNITLSIEPD